MEMRKSFTWIIIVVLFCAGNLSAQGFTVNASVDSTQLWIGQQTALTFEINQTQGLKIQTPVFSDVIIKGLDMVDPVRNDTAISPDGHLIIRQKYQITSFEDSLFLIPPFPFVSGDDTVWSSSLSLKVIQPFVIDTTKNQITDIKGVLDPEFNLWFWVKKYLPWLIGIWLIAAIAVLIILISRRKRHNLPLIRKPDVPAHVVAIQKLDKIKQDKLWLQDRQKEYHTQVTDVLREYIERVYEIPAMEMTSDEVLEQLVMLRTDDKSSYLALREILQLADLVKFAKWIAMTDENEHSLANAYVFVNQTKKEEKKEDVVS